MHKLTNKELLSLVSVLIIAINGLALISSDDIFKNMLLIVLSTIIFVFFVMFLEE